MPCKTQYLALLLFASMHSFLAFVIIASTSASSFPFSGQINASSKGYELVRRFHVGIPEEGKIAANFSVTWSIPDFDGDVSKYTGIHLWLFDDEPSSWPSVDTSSSCHDVQNRAKNCPVSNCEEFEARFDHQGNSLPMNLSITQSHPRFWYIVFGRCSNTVPMLPALNYTGYASYVDPYSTAPTTAPTTTPTTAPTTAPTAPTAPPYSDHTVEIAVIVTGGVVIILLAFMFLVYKIKTNPARGGSINHMLLN